MQDNSSLSTPTQSSPSSSRWFSTRWAVLVITIVIILGGGGTGWWAWNRLASSNNSTARTEQSGTETNPNSANSDSSSTPTAAPIVTTAVQVYLLNVNDINFTLVPVTLKVETPNTHSAILNAAFDQLLDKSLPQSSAFSEIPDDTALLDLSVEDNGIHVNLSYGFEQGGGSASMTGRLGQVIYTATSLDPTAPVWISVEDQPLELLGGEGLEVSQPMTRSEFEQSFPL